MHKKLVRQVKSLYAWYYEVSKSAVSNIENAQKYRFEVKQGKQIKLLDRDSAFFHLTDLKTIAWGETYQIRLQVKVNNTWGKWSRWCWFRTHIQKTTLDSTICGLKDVNTNTLIKANPIPNATQYKFEVKQANKVETLLTQWISIASQVLRMETRDTG